MDREFDDINDDSSDQSISNTHSNHLSGQSEPSQTQPYSQFTIEPTLEANDSQTQPYTQRLTEVNNDSVGGGQDDSSQTQLYGSQAIREIDERQSNETRSLVSTPSRRSSYSRPSSPTASEREQFRVPLGVPSTPVPGSQSSIQSGAYSQRGLSSTPLAMGTPMSPSPHRNQRANPPFSNQFQVPRSDMGRSNQRLHYVLNGEGDIPPTPSTVSTALDPWDSRSEAGTVYSTNARNLQADEFQPNQLNDRGNLDLGNAYIWGTTVNVQTCINDFRLFFDDFDEGQTPGQWHGLSYYRRQLQIMHNTGESILNLNCRHLQSYSGTRSLFHQLEKYPQEIIPLMDQVVNEEYSQSFGDTEFGGRRIQVRTHSLPVSKRLRSLDPDHIDTLISVKGMVTRCSPVIPDLKQAFFRCFVCSHTLDVSMTEKGHIDEPHGCPSCHTVASMEMIHNRSLFSDKQCIRIQETPDEIPEGETPYNLAAFAYDDLVDSVRPGDRVEITGIFRAVAKRVNPRARVLNSIFKTFVDCIHFRLITASDSSLSPAGSESVSATAPMATSSASDTHLHDRSVSNGPPMFHPDRVAQFHSFAESGNVYERLVKSFAPSIWELNDVKRGALCMLFGGNLSETKEKLSQNTQHQDNTDDSGMNDDNNNNHETKASKVHQRSEINILLCGDPGTSKSQILSYVHKLSPRGIYTSGKGSSAVGLTASVVRDADSGDMVLESGALVLSDNGICCIDEFDKMSDMTRAILHEAMEQQTVSITKAGIVATLNARTAILASANPVESRYNPRLSVVENIKLPPTLLSRFDLIYLILDKPNADNDRKLARHITSLYYDEATIADLEKTNRDNNIDTVEQSFLRDYIAYARAYFAPLLSDAAGEVLIQGYLSMRALGNGHGRGGNKTITATTRQLESLIRLSQALAKMRLASEVTIHDVQEAIRLMRVATQAAATDPRTGTIDMDMISTGKTAVSRDLLIKLAEECKNILSSSHRGQRLTFANIRQLIMNRNSKDGNNESYRSSHGNSTISVTIGEIEEAMRELEAEGVVQVFDRSMSVLVR